MAEAFGKTFKRTTSSVMIGQTPQRMAQLPGGFEDYNENAPHKALRVLSPHEVIWSLQNVECPV